MTSPTASGPTPTTTPTNLPTTPPIPLVIAAMQAALRAEHRAIYGYAALGPHLSAGDAATARLDEAAHRSQRDRTSADLLRFGATPAPSAISYLVPAMSTALAAIRFARQLEEGAAAAWRYVVVQAAVDAPTAVTGPIRAGAVAALTASAVRVMRWSVRIDPNHPTMAFPGI